MSWQDTFYWIHSCKMIMEFVVIHKPTNTVLCNGDRITGSDFKPAFYRGKLRKQIVRWTNKEQAEKDIEMNWINCGKMVV